MNSFDSVIKYGLCTGCGVCQSLIGKNKVEIEINKNGYLRPVLKAHLSDKELRDFQKVCPSINLIKENIDDNYNGTIGSYTCMITGWAADEFIRQNSSSGGSLTATLLFLLEENIVDRVIHLGESRKSPFECEVFITSDNKEIVKNAGSRYMPAALLKDIDNIIDKKLKYAIVGKPSEIRALSNYMKINEKLNRNIIIKLSFLCGGTPSIKGTYNMLDEMGVQKKDVTSVKYRGNGWPGNVEVKIKDSKVFKMSYNQSWGKYLGPTSPLGDKIDFDGVGEWADIVFGDAWHCDEKGYPSFEDAEGRNLIIARNSRAADIIYEAIKKGYLIEDKVVTVDEFKKMQPSQANRRKDALERIIGLRILGIRYPKVNWKHIKCVSEKSGIGDIRVRSILGTIKRAIKSPK